jgi:hypothetical protein
MDFLFRVTDFKSNLRHFCLLCILFIPVLSACKNKFPSGHYSGALSVSGSVTSSAQAGQGVMPVGIDLVSSGWYSGIIQVKDDLRKTLYELHWRHLKRGVYELTLPFLDSKKVVLTKKASCYLGETPFRVDICFSGREFVLNILDSDGKRFFKLIADPFQVPAPIEMEKARYYGIDEAIDAVLRQNLESQIDYEKMTQALLKAKAAWLSLFPRLNIRAGSPLRFLPEMSNFAIVTVSTVLGDFLPVLLPSRWYRAYSSSALGEAELVAYRAMRANLVTHVEGFAYILDQQAKIAAEYQRLIEILGASRIRLQKGLELESLSESQFKEFDGIFKELKLEHIRVEQSCAATRRTLAQVLGLKNPDGVMGLDFGKESISIVDPQPLRRDEVLKLARERSFELEQMHYLIQSAKYDQKSHWWLSLDPSGDQNYSLGLALPSLIQVDQSRIRQLELMKAQVEQDLAQRVYEIVEAFNGDSQMYPSALEVFVNSRDSLVRFLDSLGHDGKSHTDGLASKIQSHLRNFARCQSILTDFRISRSKVDRFLLRGAYERVLPRPEPGVVPAVSKVL